MKEIILLVLLCVASIHCSLNKNEQSHHHQHKGKDGNHHLGFVGSRGKRSINSPDEPNMMRDSSENVDEGEKEEDEWPILTQTLYDIQRNIRAPKGFFGMRGKKGFTNAEKRALMGAQQNFNGLRGRTRFIESIADENVQPFIGNGIADQSYYSGVGNKIYSDFGQSNSNLGEKRAPKGFMGMRGKKHDGEVNDDDFDYKIYEKRIPSGFTGVRGKKESTSMQ